MPLRMCMKRNENVGPYPKCKALHGGENTGEVGRLSMHARRATWDVRLMISLQVSGLALYYLVYT